jgi:hypothetical protein
MDILTSSEALEHCKLLSNLIDEEIQKHAGRLNFSQFMALVLYSPNYGYYTSGSFKFGSKGDFITAPEISPLFGSTIARTISPVLQYFLDKNQPSSILEFGAGSGKLCQDILTSLHQINQLPKKYLILEVSPELRDRQKTLLVNFLNKHHYPISIEWVTDIPTHFDGVVIANEVLDAIPVDLVIKHNNHWHYWCVSRSPKASSPSFSDHWQWTLGEQVPTDILPSYLIESILQYPQGYITEIHPQSNAWINAVANSIHQGLFLTFDYGFPEKEYYHPQRHQGTHMAHHRHQAIPDMFYLPGLCDITSHVEWSSLNRTAVGNGMSLMNYQSQGAYLLHAGIGDLFLSSTDPTNAKDYAIAANAFQKLISEAEMGELFKTIAWSRNMPNDVAFENLCASLPGFKDKQRLLEA